MKAQFTKADAVEDLIVEFTHGEGKRLDPKAEADYLNHLLFNHIPAATYEALRAVMNEEPK